MSKPPKIHPLIDKFITTGLSVDFFEYSIGDRHRATMAKAETMLLWLDNPEMVPFFLPAAENFSWKILDEFDFLEYEFWAIMKGIHPKE
jgi:hypothetical protein